MVYNFTNPLDVQSAKTRLASLIKRCCIVELTEKKPKRSVQQNKYLHVILGYFASQTGNTLQYVKDNYYKKLCNHDLFVYYRNDPWIGRTEDLRSTADLPWKVAESVFPTEKEEHVIRLR